MKINQIIKAALAAVFVSLTLCACSPDDFMRDHEESGASTSSNADFDYNLSVHYLDVGQGDSIFIELPDDETMLIDAGISGEGEKIKEYINDLGYDEINILVATHPHADHIGSMAYIVESLEIDSVYMPDVSAETKTYENLITAVDEKELTVTTAQAGDTIYSESDCTVTVIAPVTIDESSLNNCSVVLMLTYDENSFLFLGDAETEELESITADMSADVLKVGHHGSRTSTTQELLNRVNPSYAVISCGTDNEYGHPHSSTLSLLEQFNVEYYRTDQDGTVIIRSDGKNISVETSEAAMYDE